MDANPLRKGALTAGVGVFVALAGGTAHGAEMATVVSAAPVSVPVSVPRQVCSEGSQVVAQAPSGAGAVLGAIAGGVIGNQFGGGFGRAAATGVGVMAGAIAGDQVEAANTPAAVVPTRRCQTTATLENRIVGYDVVYEYAGQRYSTRMDRDPGRQLAVTVQPAGLPAPAETERGGTPVPSSSAPGYPAAPTYPAQSTTVSYPPAYNYAPAPVYDTYYYPAPAYYYSPAPVYLAPPVINFGFGFYGGGYRRHWR